MTDATYRAFLIFARHLEAVEVLARAMVGGGVPHELAGEPDSATQCFVGCRGCAIVSALRTLDALRVEAAGTT